MNGFSVTRYHDFSYGHRVVGHETKCRHLHGHNGRVHFTCRAEPGVKGLDDIGRVIDFGVIKSKLCMWLEDNWDHKFLAWEKDPLINGIHFALNTMDNLDTRDAESYFSSIVYLPFNPTAENMAQYLVEVVGPFQLKGTGVKLMSVEIEETAKCSASYEVTE